MPDGQHGQDPLTHGHDHTVSPLRSLPARISMIVFGATLITSLAVTAISVRSIDAFLRGKIEQNFPAILDGAAKRLDLWYDQRLLELGVFADSGILSENAELLSPNPKSNRTRRANREVKEYLGYVLDRFTQYEALFVLGPSAEPLLWVGEHFDLPDDMIRGDLSTVAGPRLSQAISVGSERVQLASFPLAGPRGRPVGTLHAVMRMSAVGEVLALDEVDSLAEIFLLDTTRSYLAASSERMKSQAWSAPAMELDGLATVLDYYDDAGERMVGSARPVERFGWILAVEEPYSEAFAPVVSGIRRILGINLAIVLLFALAAFRVARSIAQPIEALSDTARRISEGEEGIEIPDSDRRDEVGILTRTFAEMTRRLGKTTEQMRDQNQELHRMNEILEQLSITDGLTKLHNHRYFQDHLTKEIHRAGRSGSPLSLVLIDIDDFKTWNDRLGHSGGDEILRRIAELMQGLTRETDLLARYGGEEFALLLPATDLEGAVRLAEKIRVTIAETSFFIDPPSEHRPVTVSMGVSIFAGDKQAFFDEADQALYRAKRSGRDCVMAAGQDSP
jgi:diguanylate cyclase (GGDEF)-like protein